MTIPSLLHIYKSKPLELAMLTRIHHFRRHFSLKYKHLRSDIKSIFSYVTEIYAAYIESGGMAYAVSPNKHTSDTADEVMVSLDQEFGLNFLDWHHINTLTFTIVVGCSLANKLRFAYPDVAAEFMVEIGVGTVNGTYEHPIHVKIELEEDSKAVAVSPSPDLYAHLAGSCTVPEEVNGIELKQQKVPHDEDQLDSVSLSEWDCEV
jgi:hypothetical protein